MPHGGNRTSLGAGSLGIGHIFDIASNINCAASTAQRCPDREIGIGHIGFQANLLNHKTLLRYTKVDLVFIFS